MRKVKENKTFGGHTRYFEHESDVVKTPMKFSTFFPRENVENCIIWLSGLTCTEENFITKSGVQKYLSDTKTMVLCPDTSPRGLELDKEHDSYDFGSGAGFYLNAATFGYKDHYKMYDYVAKELITLAKEKFGIKKFSISGHSMGGHGALILGLREQVFESVSAFSPIVNPVESPWGKKAFTGYLGEDESLWKSYDATELIKSGKKHSSKILIDQGLSDEFLEKELLTRNFKTACSKNGQDVEINFREGYDHSYFFISTFIESHIQFHLEMLNKL